MIYLILTLASCLAVCIWFILKPPSAAEIQAAARALNKLYHHNGNYRGPINLITPDWERFSEQAKAALIAGRNAGWFRKWFTRG